MDSVAKQNRLSQEKSPYLLQHKDNPVWWYPWGDEAFAAAKSENKPIFLSIGYSTCYWCHVMEKDSFELEEVAEVLNRNFISIKVDREERPDVDSIYMDVVTILTGHGGWPMSVFLTPDLQPFWGGTFFYRKQFVSILERLAEIWQKEKAQAIASASQITEALKNVIKADSETEIGQEFLKNLYSAESSNYDPHYGGFGRAPKFPPAMALGFLMRWHKRTQDQKALDMACHTLDMMARGGIYDQLGGGFARYSTDEKWLVPHFEKMLYDNALLSWAYLEAFQITQRQEFAEIARQTLDYILRDMTDSKGGFYSAQDAGEVGKEGEYYVWSESEVRSLLSSDEYKAFSEVYGVTSAGNFEHSQNILNIESKIGWQKLSEPTLISARKKLLEARAKRIAPHRDDKVLTAWNGLMISSFAKAYQVLGDDRYLNAAQRAAEFIKADLFRSGRLFRRYALGSSGIEAYLDDYSFLIESLINLYESDFDLKWLNWAKDLQAIQDDLLWDRESGGYFYSTAPELIVRKKDYMDNATPSGNSVSLLNLLRLNAFFGEQKYLERFKQQLKVMSPMMERYPTAFSRAAWAVDFYTNRSKEIALASDVSLIKNDPLVAFARKTFLPNKVIAAVMPPMAGEALPPLLQNRQSLHGKTTYYVCESGACKLPTTEVEQAKSQITS